MDHFLSAVGLITLIFLAVASLLGVFRVIMWVGDVNKNIIYNQKILDSQDNRISDLREELYTVKRDLNALKVSQ